jgi:hypothetical protein
MTFTRSDYCISEMSHIYRVFEISPCKAPGDQGPYSQSPRNFATTKSIVWHSIVHWLPQQKICVLQVAGFREYGPRHLSGSLMQFLNLNLVPRPLQGHTHV